MMDYEYLIIGFHKGEADFRASAAISDLDFDRMQQLRAMIPVAISSLEDLWRQLGPMSKVEAHALPADAHRKEKSK